MACLFPVCFCELNYTLSLLSVLDNSQAQKSAAIFIPVQDGRCSFIISVILLSFPNHRLPDSFHSGIHVGGPHIRNAVNINFCI